VLLLAADPCFAAGGGGGERSMFERALDLGVWTLCVFLILLFVLTKYAWKPMLQGLEKRENTIAEAVEEAKKAKEAAAELQRQIAAEKQKLADETRKMYDENRKKAEEHEAARKAEFETVMQAERERALREINIAKDQATKELFVKSAQLASVISAKVVGRQLNDDDHHRLVDEALADMNQAVAARRQTLGAGSNA
jgi:F-type H+-transporting ATPase subunit b